MATRSDNDLSGQTTAPSMLHHLLQRPTAEELVATKERLYQSSSNIALAIQMLNASWNASQQLDKEILDLRAANNHLMSLYSELEKGHEETVRNHRDLGDQYVDLLQDLQQYQKINEQYESLLRQYKDVYTQKYFVELEERVRTLEQEKQDMERDHRTALIIAAERISAAERKMDELMGKTELDSAPSSARPSSTLPQPHPSLPARPPAATQPQGVRSRRRGRKGKGYIGQKELDQASAPEQDEHGMGIRPESSMSSLPHDKPHPPRGIDREIGRHHGVTVSLEASRSNLQATKTTPTPSLSQIIEQRTWENGRLRKELACQHRKEAASMFFLEEISQIAEKMQQVVGILEDLRMDIEKDGGDEVMLAQHPRQ